MMYRLAHFLLLGLWCAACAWADTAKRPNIVLLVADDWGFSDVGAFGGEMATPNLDDLAKRGVRFSNFHVTASCAPTRSILMTGVDNHRNGVGNMPETIPRSHEGQPGYLGVLDRNVVTVASLLQDAGYFTNISGKWHLGHETHNLPPARGFDRSFIQADSGSDNWEKRPYLALKDKVYWYEEGKDAVLPENFYSSTLFIDKAIDYIKINKASGKPFFSYIAFQANHIPIQAPKPFIDKYKGKYKDGWTVLRQKRRDRAIELGLIPKDAPMVTMASTESWDALSEQDKAYQARRMEVYAGMADAMDHEIGRLITYLKEIGQFDNTVFVFMSDNGAEASDPYSRPSGRLWLDAQYSREFDRLGAKGAYSIIGPSWASAAASPLSTYKFWSGEGGIRVPLIISGVADGQQDQIVKSFAHVADITPTLLSIAGVDAPKGNYKGAPVEPLIGNSLVPVIQGKSERAHAVDEPIGYELSGNLAVFKGDYKLLKNSKPIGDGEWHLYNITTDPGEVNDVQKQFPDTFRLMQQDYAAYAKANGVLPMPDDYDPLRQVEINAFYNNYVTRMKAAAPWVLLGLGALGYGLVAWRRRRR